MAHFRGIPPTRMSDPGGGRGWPECSSLRGATSDEVGRCRSCDQGSTELLGLGQFVDQVLHQQIAPPGVAGLFVCALGGRGDVQSIANVANL